MIIDNVLIKKSCALIGGALIGTTFMFGMVYCFGSNDMSDALRHYQTMKRISLKDYDQVENTAYAQQYECDHFRHCTVSVAYRHCNAMPESMQIACIHDIERKLPNNTKTNSENRLYSTPDERLLEQYPYQRKPFKNSLSEPVTHYVFKGKHYTGAIVPPLKINGQAVRSHEVVQFQPTHIPSNY